MNSTVFQSSSELTNNYSASKGSTLFDSHIPRTDLHVTIPPGEGDENSPQQINMSYRFIRTMSTFLRDITQQKGATQTVYLTWVETSPLVNALWSSKNLTETFDYVARSLINQMRNSAANASHIRQVSGVTKKWEIHVHARWAYMAFPAAMIAIGALYVLLTIVESTRLHVSVWKESALPSLLHGVDNETQSLLRHAQSRTKTRKVHETVVRFGYDEKDDCVRLMTAQDVRR